MIPYLGSEFIRALLGLPAGDEAAEGVLGTTAPESRASHGRMKTTGNEHRNAEQGVARQSANNSAARVVKQSK
jgi:hypothetical protein